MSLQTIKKTQDGAVLLLAMVFLLLMAIVAGTVMQTSILEFFMAGNDQFREEAFQQAQAIASEITEDLDNFPVVGGVGYTVCPSGCNATTKTLASDDNLPAGVNSDYRVVRRGPLIVESMPFRLPESSSSSSPAFDAALFETQVGIDGSDVRLGSAEVVYGVAVRVASSSQ